MDTALRRPRAEDAAALYDLVATCDLAEIGEVDYEVADAVAELGTPGLDLDADAWVVEGAGRLDGYAAAHHHHGTGQVGVELYAHPDTPDLLPDLLGRVRRRAAEHAAAAGLAAATARLWCVTGDSPIADLLVAGGWRIVRRNVRMLAQPVAASVPDPPPGVAVRRIDGEPDERRVHQIIERSFAGQFDHTPREYDAWARWQRNRAGYDRDRWLLGTLHGEPVGSLVARRLAETGWVGGLGVLQRARGRGIGRALLLASFADFAGIGYDQVQLGVDTANESGALRLYESAGMRRRQEHDCWQLDVPALRS